MTSTQATVPQELHGFDIGLGKSILRELGAMGVTLPDEVVESASADSHLTSALGWRKSNRVPLQVLANIARRAGYLTSDEDAYARLREDLDNNVEGVQTFLDESSPSYLRSTVQASRGLDGKEFRAFLELLQILPA